MIIPEARHHYRESINIVSLSYESVVGVLYLALFVLQLPALNN